MDVEIFSDVVCPWCAIGKRRFETALGKFAHAEDVEVRWRAFELDPSAPRVVEGDPVENLAKKYGMTREQAVESQSQLAATGAAEGLDLRFDQTKRGNSFDAHRLLQYAHEVGMQGALKERLLSAYFAEGESISDIATLVRLGRDVGLDADKALDVLESGRYSDEVRAEEQLAQQLGIRGVPFFVIDGKYGISGAQSPELLLEALDKIWAEEHPIVTVESDDGSSCEGDSCAV